MGISVGMEGSVRDLSRGWGARAERVVFWPGGGGGEWEEQGRLMTSGHQQGTRKSVRRPLALVDVSPVAGSPQISWGRQFLVRVRFANLKPQAEFL